MKKVTVGDEFHKGLTVVRVTSIERGKKCPVTYTWVTYSSGTPADGETGAGSHKGTFEFFKGEGFTYHPAWAKDPQ